MEGRKEGRGRTHYHPHPHLTLLSNSQQQEQKTTTKKQQEQEQQKKTRKIPQRTLTLILRAVVVGSERELRRSWRGGGDGAVLPTVFLDSDQKENLIKEYSLSHMPSI